MDLLSMYLDVAVSTTFQLSLAVVNQICSNFTIWKARYMLEQQLNLEGMLEYYSTVTDRYSCLFVFFFFSNC
ncbi:hypothetical protein HanPSC8_Chr10g0449171 [Helianthus annuus]|nr:hypothetical protein HanPSC8_Chr10g0449171 [Helianthus annuus]